ncbi:MAG: hypothetical protein E6X21_03245 [Clostridium sp.]|uniref:hypothetical protein n=1 Tax=Clostridium sp. TaxID=1506 RepID=UPI00290650EE|nr:hypothetical protein [Clostridium sp.]
MNKYVIYVDETKVHRHKINVEGNISQEELDQLCKKIDSRSFSTDTVMRSLARDRRFKSIKLSLDSEGSLANINIPKFEVLDK